MNPNPTTANEAGKGDSYRPVDQKKWSENYDRIFKQHDAPNTQQTPRNAADYCTDCGRVWYNCVCAHED